MQFLHLRAMFLLAFVVAMPVLALPAVARRIDELLYPPPAANFSAGPSVGPMPAKAETQAPVAGEVSPASWQTPESPAAPQRGLEFAIAEPPPLPAAPNFSSATAPPLTAKEEPPIDQATLDRLEQIRSRLEQLGAQYVLVEASGDASQYRCHCQMLVDAQSKYTRPFEATTASPLDAAEQVLRDVERWRVAAAASSTLR